MDARRQGEWRKRAAARLRPRTSCASVSVEPASLRSLSFDRVLVASKTLSVDSFVRLPLRVRVRHLLNNEVTFLYEDMPVQAAAALAELRALTTREGKAP